MSLTDKQISELEKKLDPAVVANRQIAGRNTDYIEGWYAIKRANEIFGFDGWSRETVLTKLHDPIEGVKNDKTQWNAAFTATVTITVEGVVRQGVGYGDGYAARMGEAMESAIKEAETDATKRALMTFGNQFGLALYDKQKRGVGIDDAEGPIDPKPPSPQNAKAHDEHHANIMSSDSLDALKIYGEENADNMNALPDDLAYSLRVAYSEKKALLIKQAKEAK